MIRFMQWLHRWVSLVLVIQVALWLVSGLFFSLTGHHGMSGHQYMVSKNSEPPLKKIAPQIDVTEMHQRFPLAHSIELVSVAGVGQYQVSLPDGRLLYFNADTGERWSTDQALATQLALNSYNGPGQVERVEGVKGSDEVNGWNASGFRIDIEDDLNTRIYIDEASSQVVEHRNTPWTIADWAFRLHFMDYTGGRSFNHLLIWSAGLFALWFSLSGLILLGRNITNGDFNPNRKKTWLEYFQQKGKPIASSCGGGGTCGLCKVTLQGSDIPSPKAAEKALLSANELDAGMRLSCQHRTSTNYEVKLHNEGVSDIALTLDSKRQLTPSIMELTFVSSEPVNYEAGQFMQFRIPHLNEILSRHYSVATRPHPTRFVFNVRQLPSPSEGVPPGIGSNYLCNLEPGAHVDAIGPFGDFQLTKQNNHTQVFIGGGAGVAPLRALIQSELAADSPRRCIFFYGARYEKELCYRDEFERDERLNYIPVLSEVAKSDEWAGHTGFVHETAMKWLADENKNTLDVYVCGPPPMLKATLKSLADFGIPRERIKFDDFGI
ncbi:NADH:quinone oxidoreductase [Idiomarina sp. WRN-38]|uniref:2Fe-2S iron-sulfur cluster-binding protein n=1 Tax=Idiomarina sp. OXR-189 TaxID=3100175 RepID=UPI0007338E01|nr:2Fe-2S iron-sulfur cluster-binding protein [Idiomarina sp. OXR-189]KTG25079.1 NADH:quinone oxidoreductase [Idiomarina sp. H105]OAE94643.1 NADH:quinone oxidoreductase [Idiomarina sp. WRN-38]WPZ00745.1 PepSY domain-containing protein [Idiomarina sp. OXR-189]